jgi:hypothetical protein
MLSDTLSQPLKEKSRRERRHLLTLLRTCFTINPLLTLFGVAMIITSLGTLIGIVVDHRVITGVPAWVKPAKFAISLSIYSFTFLWLSTFIQGHKRLISTVTNIIAIAVIIEMVIITTQVVRGTTSHFNFSTPLDGALFSTMGISIVVFALMHVIVAILLLFQRIPDPAFAWSLRLGLLLFIAGMSVAFLMTQPTPMQMAAAHAGTHMTTIGAHSVGVPDGGPGLPFLGWSTIGGDLRIAHFVGLHALQILPLLGLWISRRANMLSMGHRVALVWTVGLSYLGLVGLLTWQALRAQPLIAPDALTLQALGSLLSATVLAIILIFAHAQARAAEYI